MASAKFVLVTGASSGIGQEAVFRLAEKGIRVFAGVRSQKAIDQLTKRRFDEGLEKELVRPLRLDVTQTESIQQAIELISEQVGAQGLAGLVNNAGIAVAGPVESVPLERFRAQFDVNFFGLIELTQKALPLLRLGKGRLVNVSSISGRIASPGLGAYSASKFAVEALSDALRRELRSQGVHVSLIEPGPIQTPIWDKSGHDAHEMEKSLSPEQKELYGEIIEKLIQIAQSAAKNALPPSRVADAIEHALLSKKPKIRYPIGTPVQASVTMARLLPDAVMDFLVDQQMHR